ncbi:hypothetical protein BSKO_11996 [Bryopsis sp. KO-2023]|nr:hypothetical protein BSKO_11996 [Bryopsis sp. KO-2023]
MGLGFLFVSILAIAFCGDVGRAATDMEVNALLEMRHSFIDIKGKISDWNPLNISRVCEWTGITCNENRNIKKITLTQKELSGVVTPLVAYLEFLEELRLNQNNLKGNLPNVMGLPNLRIIRMDLNSFTGGFYFHDAQNWLSPLGKSLEEIFVDQNQLRGSVDSAPPETFSQSPIQVLRYGKQFFYGTIPHGYEGFPELHDLRIGYNEFYGTVPKEWEAMKLKNLYLPRLPGICGEKPEFATDPFFTDLGTTFGVECPEPPAYYQEEVDVLLSLMESLKPPPGILVYWTNETKAIICSGWTGITCDPFNHVTSIILDSMQLKGNLNEDIHKLDYLQELSLMDNELEGPLPDISRFRVKKLKLCGNRLSGPTPLNDRTFWESELAASMRELWLHDNEFSGEFRGGRPNIFWRSPLLDLRLRGNRIQGTLPEGIEGILRLQTLTLGSNHFTGTVPSDWLKMQNITKLDLYNLTSVCGDIPAFGNDTFVNIQNSSLGNSCSNTVTSGGGLSDEDSTTLRRSLANIVHETHLKTMKAMGWEPSNEKKSSWAATRKKLLVTLGVGIGSLMVFSILSFFVYGKMVGGAPLNADLTKSFEEW